MSSGAARPHGVDFSHVADDFKVWVGHRGRTAPAISLGFMIGRRRNSSVPLMAVVIALVVIAVLALLAYYVGDGALLTRFADPPFIGSEDGIH